MHAAVTLGATVVPRSVTAPRPASRATFESPSAWMASGLSPSITITITRRTLLNTLTTAPVQQRRAQKEHDPCPWEARQCAVRGPPLSAAGDVERSRVRRAPLNSHD